MILCCDGSTCVEEGPRDEWAVLCVMCGRVLRRVTGPREEVFADL